MIGDYENTSRLFHSLLPNSIIVDTDMHTDADFIDMEKLLPDAIESLIELQDFDHYQQWMMDNIQNYVSRYKEKFQDDLFSGTSPYDPAMLNSFAHLFALALWNITPLPSNDFRPLPRPMPGRNAPCPCGSGLKFKRCCQPAYAEMPSLSTDLVWPILLEKLDKDLLAAAIQSRRIPVEGLASLARDHLNEGHPKKGAKLLEPLFNGKMQGTDERHGFAMDTLLDIYDDLGFNKKKQDLLQHIIDHAGRTPLRSAAWQRLAAIRMDQGDNAGAWGALRNAQQDDPGNPYLGILEVQLLLNESRTQEAQERARFWHKKIRHYDSGADPIKEFFTNVIADPHQAMLDLTTDMEPADWQRLQTWIERVSDRPVPDYVIEIQDDDHDIPSDKDETKRVEGLGAPDKDIELISPDLDEDFDMEASGEEDDFPEDEYAFYQGRHFGMLTAPAGHDQLAAQWREHYPLEKPFSVNDEPFMDVDPWSPAFADNWLAFLEGHPEAWDNLSILDDLATVIQDLRTSQTPWVDQKLLEPILARSLVILEQALNGADEIPVLEWAMLENRPALRSLYRMMLLVQRRNQPRQLAELAQKMLLLNPYDNHGIRTLVIEYLLEQNDNEGAIALTEDYPDDIQPDLPFGKALALFRLGRQADADRAIQAASERFPKVVPMLLKKSPRQPKMSAYGITPGGEDQAWLYHQQARELWQNTPGAMKWLKRYR